MGDLASRLGALAVAVPFVLGLLSGPAASDEAAVDRLVRLDDPRITESSGLAVAGDHLVTTNDSGDIGRVFTLDPTTGDTVGVTTWSQDAVDCEALAPADDDHVWVGDIGDNGADRPFVTVTKVPVGTGEQTVDVPSYRLVYPKGEAHDAESLMSDPTTGRLYLATKEILGGTLYAVPRDLDADRVNRLKAVGPVVTTATDGAFLPGGRALIVRGYFDATVYAWPSLRALGSFPMPHQRQGEGLAVRPDDSLLLSSEGPRSWILADRLPAALAALVAPPSPTASPTSPPTASGVRPVDADDRLTLISVGAGSVALVLMVGMVLTVLWRRRAR